MDHKDHLVYRERPDRQEVLLWALPVHPALKEFLDQKEIQEQLVNQVLMVLMEKLDLPDQSAPKVRKEIMEKLDLRGLEALPVYPERALLVLKVLRSRQSKSLTVLSMSVQNNA